jgi:hypothetical protein
MTHWWLSFCDPNRPEGQRLLGGCIVQADSMAQAMIEAHIQGCNPGGEVVGIPITPQYEHNIAQFGVNVLVPRDVLLKMAAEEFGQ